MLRKATQHDVADIMRTLLAMLAKSPAPQMKYADPVEAECSVRHAIHEGRGWFYDGYFIMVDFGKEWYSRKLFLIEQIIVRVYDSDSSARDAIAQLDVIAARVGASLIAVGDTQVGHMVHSYQDEGYRVLGMQLIKEVPYGVRSQDHGPAVDDRRGQEAEPDSADRAC